MSRCRAAPPRSGVRVRRTVECRFAPSRAAALAAHSPEEVGRSVPVPGASTEVRPASEPNPVSSSPRAQPENRDLRLVALTGYGTDADRVKTRAAGFDVHLAKPVDPQALEALLARWA